MSVKARKNKMDEAMKARLSSLIQEFLQELSQYELADRLGVTQPTIHIWVQGKVKTELDIGSMRRIAQFRGWTLDELDAYLIGHLEDKSDLSFNQALARVPGFTLGELAQLVGVIAKAIEYKAKLSAFTEVNDVDLVKIIRDRIEQIGLEELQQLSGLSREVIERAADPDTPIEEEFAFGLSCVLGVSHTEAFALIRQKNRFLEQQLQQKAPLDHHAEGANHHCV